MKRARKLAVVVSVNILLALIGAEFASAVVYYFQSGEFFYTRQKPSSTETEPAAARGKHVMMAFHPYMGYQRRAESSVMVENSVRYLRCLYGTEDERAWAGLETNNMGFFSTVDYPYVPGEKDEFIVAVLGGSVAKYFGISGADHLIERLAEHGYGGDKPIKVLNLGQAGYKQPQQVNLLVYLLTLGQKVDLVINIDGYNEIAHGAINEDRGLDSSMPCSVFYLALRSLIEVGEADREMLILLGEAETLKKHIDSIDARRSQTRFAIVYHILSLSYRNSARRLRQTLIEIEETGSSRVEPLVYAPAPMDDTSVYERIAFGWAEASLVLHHLLIARDIPYVHVLQPNQYYSNHPFSEEEKRIAIRDDFINAPKVAEGYPYLIAELEYLRSEGVQVVNAVELFDAESRMVYGDGYCHLNRLGNVLMADAIADCLLEQ